MREPKLQYIFETNRGYVTMSGDADSLEYGKSWTQSPTSAIWYTFALEISAVLIDKKDSFTNAAKGTRSTPPWE